MRIVIPVLFLLSAIAMRRWEFLIPAPVPNLVLALAAAGAVRRTHLVTYFAGALLAAFALSYPSVVRTEALAFLAIAGVMYFASPRLAWRERVALPLFIALGAAALHLFSGGAFMLREPLAFIGEVVSTLAASVIFALIINHTK